MRTKYSIAACLFAFAFFTSCNDSFLQRDPKDKYSDVSFWKTPAEAEKYVTGINLYLVATENHTIIVTLIMPSLCTWEQSKDRCQLVRLCQRIGISNRFGMLPMRVSDAVWCSINI